MTVTDLPVLSVKLYKLFCPSSVIPGAPTPEPTDIWFPVPDTVITLPDVPEIVVNPVVIPGNSADPGGCFDPDSLDLSQIFNNLLPTEDTPGTGDVELDVDVLVPIDNELIPLQATLKLFAGVKNYTYDLIPKVTSFAVAIKIPAPVVDLVGKIACGSLALGLGSSVTSLRKLIRLSARPSFSLGLELVPARLSYSELASGTLRADPGAFVVNEAFSVLLLSHFDTEFDEQTGNTVGYNWYSTRKPGIGTDNEGVFGSGYLFFDDYVEYLYTFLNPSIFTDSIPEWTLEGWVYIPSGFFALCPFCITADGNADEASFSMVLEESADNIRFGIEVKNATTDFFRIFRCNISGELLNTWHHVAWEQSVDGHRFYWNGRLLPNRERSEELVLPFDLPSFSISNPINIKSGIMFGNQVWYVGDDYYGSWFGRMDEVRLVDKALYRGNNFEPPTSAYEAEPPLPQASFARTLPALIGSSGSVVLDGKQADFSQPGKVLSANPVNYVLSGENITLKKPSSKFVLEHGSFVLSGKPTVDIPTFVGSRVVNISTGESSIVWPVGHSASDLGVIVTESSATSLDSRPITAPYGWAPLDRWPVEDGISYCTVFYKFATSSAEPNVPLIAFADHQIVALLVFRKVDTSSPFVAFESKSVRTFETQVKYPDVYGIIPRASIIEIATNGRDTTTSDAIGSRTNASDAWVYDSNPVLQNTSLGDGGGITVYLARTTKQLNSGLPGTIGTGVATPRTLGTLVLRPKGWVTPPMIQFGNGAARIIELPDGSSNLLGSGGLYPSQTDLEADGWTYIGGGGTLDLDNSYDDDSVAFDPGVEWTGLDFLGLGVSSQNWKVADCGVFFDSDPAANLDNYEQPITTWGFDLLVQFFKSNSQLLIAGYQVYNDGAKDWLVIRSDHQLPHDDGTDGIAIETWFSQNGEIRLVYGRPVDLGGKEHYFVVNLDSNGIASNGSLVTNIPGLTVNGNYAVEFRPSKLKTSAGALSLTGLDSGLVYLRNLTLIGSAGDFIVTGHSADLTGPNDFLAETGVFDLTGQISMLKRLIGPKGDAGAFTLSGVSAQFSRALTLEAEATAYTLTGQSALLGRPPVAITADAGICTLAGQVAAFALALNVLAEAASYATTGQDAAFSLGGGTIDGGDATSSLVDIYDGGDATSSLVDIVDGGTA